MSLKLPSNGQATTLNQFEELLTKSHNGDAISQVALIRHITVNVCSTSSPFVISYEYHDDLLRLTIHPHSLILHTPLIYPNHPYFYPYIP